jgi:hypothetical protein
VTGHVVLGRFHLIRFEAPPSFVAGVVSRKEGEGLAAKHFVGSRPPLGPTTPTTVVATVR